MSNNVAKPDNKTWAEQWAELCPRPEWDDPKHWEGARGVMTDAQRDLEG